MNKLTAKYILQIKKLESDITNSHKKYNPITRNLITGFLTGKDYDLETITSEQLALMSSNQELILQVMNFEKYPDDCRLWRQFLNLINQWKEELEIVEIPKEVVSEIVNVLNEESIDLIEKLEEKFEIKIGDPNIIEIENCPGLNLDENKPAQQAMYTEANTDSGKTIGDIVPEPRNWLVSDRTIYHGETAVIGILSNSEYNEFRKQLCYDYSDIKENVISPYANLSECIVYDKEIPEKINYHFHYYNE